MADESVNDDVAVCDFCAGAFDVETVIDESGVERLAEYDGHPSIRDFVVEGYEVITF